NHSVFISVVDSLSHGMKIIYKDATNAITSTWAGTGVLQEVTNLASPAAYEGVKQYRYNYSLNNWWDGFGLVSDGNGTLNIKSATNLMIAYQGPAAGNYIYLQLITRTNMGGKSLSPQVILPYAATYKLTNISLSLFTNSTHPADFTRYSELDVGITGTVTGTGSLFVDDIAFLGGTNSGSGTSAGMFIGIVSVSPVSITNGKSNLVVVNCRAFATNGVVAGVSANFSQLGGSASLPMTNIGGSNYRCSMIA